MTHLQKAIIKMNLPNIETYAFYKACPFTLTELREKNRNVKIVVWRQIGMAIESFMRGGLENGAEHFRKNHATAIHGIKRIANMNATDHQLISAIESIKFELSFDSVKAWESDWRKFIDEM